MEKYNLKNLDKIIDNLSNDLFKDEYIEETDSYLIKAGKFVALVDSKTYHEINEMVVKNLKPF